MEVLPTCAAITRAGRRCQAPPLRGGHLCAAHDPDHPFASHDHAVAAGRLGGRVARLSLPKLPADVLDAVRAAAMVPVYGEDGHAGPGALAHNPTKLR